MTPKFRPFPSLLYSPVAGNYWQSISKMSTIPVFYCSPQLSVPRQWWGGGEDCSGVLPNSLTTIRLIVIKPQRLGSLQLRLNLTPPVRKASLRKHIISSTVVILLPAFCKDGRMLIIHEETHFENAFWEIKIFTNILQIVQVLFGFALTYFSILYREYTLSLYTLYREYTV